MMDHPDDAFKDVIVESEEPGPSAIARLRGALAPRVVDAFEEGDVIRWKSGIYQYAVIKAKGKYWFTGGGSWYGTRSVNYDDLIAILNRAEVSDVAVATAWAQIV